MSTRRVVIIMPVYNEAKHLPLVLASISAQTFPLDRVYFVGVDGASNDGSDNLLTAWLAERGIAGRLLSNPRRAIPISLNMGLDLTAADDIIMRLDGHTIYGETYIADAVAALEHAPPDVACIGSAHRPIPGRTFAERVVEALYTNPMGLGGADYRFGDDVRAVDNVYLGTWRPGVLQRLGGFNEALVANEDGEMSARIRKAGYRILRVPLSCRFAINRGLAGTIRQWNRYGYWRAKMLQSNPQFVRLRHIASPGAAVIAIALACSPFRVFLLPLFGAYSALVLRGRNEREPAVITLATLAYFPILQFAYAAGMIAGLLTGRQSQPVQEVSIGR